MLEVPRENTGGKCHGIPDDKAVVSSAPRNHVIGVLIINQFICFGEERRGTHVVKSFHWSGHGRLTGIQWTQSRKFVFHEARGIHDTD